MVKNCTCLSDTAYKMDDVDLKIDRAAIKYF